MNKHWIVFTIVVVVSFSVLGWVGSRIYQEAPPIPDKIITSDGQIVLVKKDIEEGQNIW